MKLIIPVSGCKSQPPAVSHRPDNGRDSLDMVRYCCGILNTIVNGKMGEEIRSLNAERAGCGL